MRIVLTIFATLLIGSSCTTAWSQSVDPFGQRDRPVRDDPFGANADPFSPPTLGRPAKGSQATHGKAHSSAPAGVRAAAARNKMVLNDARVGSAVASAKPSDTRQKIQTTLDANTIQTFIETPLSDAIQTLSVSHDIPISIDRRALEEIGLDSDAGVTIDMKNMSLRGFLRLMLRDLDMTYMVREEYLEITTLEAAENRLITEMYVLPDSIVPKSDDVIEVMSASINPGTWVAQGGSSNAIAFDHVLVVSTTSDTHDEVGKFLEKLIQKYGE